jgi:hypothetical protein
MNIFIACDGIYYEQWGMNCLKTIRYHVPWINLTAHIVNPVSKFELDNVTYHYEERSFVSEASRISYYQAVRFLKCYDYFPNDELVMTIDCDTVLMKPFTQKEFIKLCRNISVQRHQKDIRWMAGLVTYGSDSLFKQRLQQELLSRNIDDWSYGWDQDVLDKLSNEFAYNKLMVGEWMSFGRGRGIFLTLKGDQKTSEGYLNNYKEGLIRTHE